MVGFSRDGSGVGYGRGGGKGEGGRLQWADGSRYGGGGMVVVSGWGGL